MRARSKVPQLSPDISAAIEAAKRQFENRKSRLINEHPDLFAEDDNGGSSRLSNPRPLPPRKMVIEQNILEKPFTVYNNRQSKEKRQIIIESDSDVTIITAVPDDKGVFHGLPIPFDRKCLFTVMINSKSLKSSNEIRISKHALCRQMGIKPSGQIYKSIDGTQQRLFNTIISTTAGWFDPVQKKRVASKFRILSRIADTGLGELVWWLDDVIVKSFRENYIKTLDYDRFISIENPVAQFLFGLISKRMGAKNEWQKNFYNFLIEIGCGHYLLMEPYRRNEHIKNHVLLPLEELRPDFRFSIDGPTILFYR